ncbi:MAG: ParA family protein [Anaerolineae bacterium]
MPVIAIANQKGGTGKTTTAINLSAALGELGRRVLLVDLDPQANATLHAGVMPEQQERTVWTAMQLAADGKEADALEKEDLRRLLDSLWEERHFDPRLVPVVRHPNGNAFDLVPSSLELSEADLALAAAVNRERRLAIVLSPLKDYDYIVIDCPPHLGLLTLNALTAADSVILPLESAFLASKGMNQLFRIILQVKQTLNHRLNVLGILITRVDQRTTHSRTIASEARTALEKRVRVFKTEIPANVDLADASAAGVSVLRYSPNSRGAAAYRQLAREIEATHGS